MSEEGYYWAYQYEVEYGTFDEALVDMRKKGVKFEPACFYAGIPYRALYQRMRNRKKKGRSLEGILTKDEIDRLNEWLFARGCMLIRGGGDGSKQ